MVFGQIRKQLGSIFHELARQKECRILEGHLMPDHVHMCIEIPPQFPVASIIGFLKGKSAIALRDNLQGKSEISRANTFGHKARRKRHHLIPATVVAHLDQKEKLREN